MKIAISTNKAPGAVGPYSQAVKAGNFLFISGQLPLPSGPGELIKNNITSAAIQVLENIKGILESEGLSFRDIVKTTVFIKNMKDFPVVNEVYSNYFEKPYPARACVEVSNLPKGVEVEIEAVAYYETGN